MLEHTKSDVDELVAVSEAHAARLSGFSIQRLRRWSDRGVVGPSLHRRLSARNTVRLYRFNDLVQLLVAAELLRAGRSAQQIRRVVEHLRARDYQAPLRELVFGVSGDRIVFQHPDGTWEDDTAADQIVIREVIDLEVVRAKVRQSVAGAREQDAGRIERRRATMGSKPLFKGTRTPVEAVESYLRRGLPDSRILDAFPHLRPEDIDEARRHLASA